MQGLCFYNSHQPLQEELKEVVDIPDPDVCIVADRKAARIQAENDKFDPEYYMYRR